jgi:hypothetical protein
MVFINISGGKVKLKKIPCLYELVKSRVNNNIPRLYFDYLFLITKRFGTKTSNLGKANKSFKKNI